MINPTIERRRAEPAEKVESRRRDGFPRFIAFNLVLVLDDASRNKLDRKGLYHWSEDFRHEKSFTREYRSVAPFFLFFFFFATSKSTNERKQDGGGGGARGLACVRLANS